MAHKHPEFGIAMTAEQYANEWDINSRYFKDTGQYDWMLKQLGPVRIVLEIGCGSGSSTQKIASSGCEVLAFDVNEEAVKRAAANVKAAGYEVSVLTVQDLVGWAPGGAGKINIVCADVFDQQITDALPKGAFDAVLCWMTGSYPEHIGSVLGKSYENFDGKEMSEFRLKVQQRSYEIGNHALKYGGFVHIVDRGAMESWNDKDALRSVLAENQGALAGPNFRIGKEDTMFNKLTGPFNTSNIQYLRRSEGGNAKVNVMASSKARKC